MRNKDKHQHMMERSSKAPDAVEAIRTPMPASGWPILRQSGDALDVLPAISGQSDVICPASRLAL